MLYQHQKNAVEFVKKSNGIAALFMDCGTGKTVTALECFRTLKNPTQKMVVIAPLSLLESAWGEDIRKFTNFTYWNAHKQGLPPPNYKEDILLINYESIILKKYLMLYKYIMLNMLVLDESSKIKSHNSQTTRQILKFRNLAAYKLIMSGTPAPNTPLEYWAQIELLSPNLLHKSFYGFRNTYFHLQRGKEIFSIPQGTYLTKDIMRNIMTKGFQYEISPENLKKLMDKINPLIFWAKKEECLDLPDQIDEVRKVKLSDEQNKAYQEMKKYLITILQGQPVTAEVALSKIMKLREITSGFVYQGEEVIPIKSRKLAELLDIIEEVGNKPIIVWAVFKYDVELIQKTLAKLYGDDTVVTLYSRTKDKDESIRKFKNNECRFMVANPASAAHGLTFVNCDTQIFYSLDYSWERYTQAKSRIHRIGQKFTCLYIHLLAENTIDDEIYACLTKKKNLEEITYKFIKGE